jgi:modulator of FtsH protease HflK
MKQNDDPITDLLSRIGQRPRGGRGAAGPRPPKPTHLLFGLVAALVVLGVMTSFFTVQPEERAVVKRFGSVYGIADPGLHFKLPFGIDTVQHVATERVLKQEFGFRTAESAGFDRTQFTGPIPDESLMLTGDLNIIQVEWVVQYRIADPIQFLYGMRNPTQTLRDLSESVMRRVVGNRVGSEVLTTARVDIANTAREEIQQAMDAYLNGVHVITVELQDVVPPPRVQPAFNEVNEARQERERMINEANRQANQAIPRAQGTAQRIIAEAEGYATERVNRAFGEASRFSAVLAEYQGVPEVTRSRLYLETLNETLPRIGSLVVLRGGESQIPPLPLLNLREGQASAAAQPSQPAQPRPQPASEPLPLEAERASRNIGRTR